METLKTDVVSLTQRVSKVSSQVSVAQEQIKSQMQDFLQFAENKMDILQNEINDMESIRQRLCDFLCEDVASFKMEECFKVFHNFCSRFKSALQENEKRQKQEQLAEARRKQREEQIALKRRSLELPDPRSSIDADHIMDQLLGDIRSGFADRCLSDIYRRSKSCANPDDNNSLNIKRDDSKRRSQNALKRHSDPAMLEKGRGIIYQGDKPNQLKNRKAGFLDESSEEIIGFLRNQHSGDFDQKERRLFGSNEDGLEKITFRRSGRRKRVELLNGDTHERERSGSSPPPPALLPAEKDLETKSNQSLRAKINDWMLQNEKEQRREHDLQLKLLQERKKRQLTNGQTENNAKGCLKDISEGDQNKKKVGEEINNDSLEREKFSEEFKLTKAAQVRQSESFTQKIIGLLDAASNSAKPFVKTRLYHSTREKKTEKELLEEKSKDDTDLDKLSDSQVQYGTKTAPPYVSPNLEVVKEEDKKLVNGFESNFDRFASTRKTQRRLKLREMRIEAENVIKAKSGVVKSVNGDKNIQTSNDRCISDAKHSSIHEETKTVDDKDFKIISLEEPFVSLSQVNPCSPNSFNQDKGPDNENTMIDNIVLTPEISDSSAKTNDCTEIKERKTSQPRSTSLRSRQSRLARRINSLSTPVTSPTTNENVAFIGIEKELIDSENSNINSLVKSHVSNDQDNLKKNFPISTQNKEIEHEEMENQISQNGDQKLLPPESKDKERKSSEEIRETADLKPKTNGHISHKVTVNTETKSEVILPKSNKVSNKNIKVNLPKIRTAPTKPTTNIPSVIKTTQNLKVQQTIQRQTPHMNGKVTTAKSEVKTRLNSVGVKSGSPKPSLSTTKEKTSDKDNKSKSIAGDKTEMRRNGESSPSSTISSICSLSTNVNLRNGKVVNGKTIQPVKKITINHNGSVKFSKSNVSIKNSPKTTPTPLGNCNSNMSGKNNETINKKDKSSAITKRAFI